VKSMEKSNITFNMILLQLSLIFSKHILGVDYSMALFLLISLSSDSFKLFVQRSII
jgi:hypothetical protein